MTPELPKQPDEIPPPPSLPSPNSRAAKHVSLPAADRNIALGVHPGLPIAGARPPTALACLHCQLIGRRRLLCSKADACAELPHSFAVGPVLLAAWLATAIAFIVAVL
jgi:hypothetical protein